MTSYLNLSVHDVTAFQYKDLNCKEYLAMVMLWIKLPVFLIFSYLCGFGTAQRFDSNCNETEGCTEVINCIRHYVDLETYAVNNRTLVEKLAETFFTSQTSTFLLEEVPLNLLRSHTTSKQAMAQSL